MNLDLPSETHRRLIVLVVEPAHDIGIDYEGEFALWEVRSVLEAALDKVILEQVNEPGEELDDEEGIES